jgi:hypothetical protein
MAPQRHGSTRGVCAACVCMCECMCVCKLTKMSRAFAAGVNKHSRTELIYKFWC